MAFEKTQNKLDELRNLTWQNGKLVEQNQQLLQMLEEKEDSALIVEIEEAKKVLADAINTKGGSASAESSFQQLAEDIENLNDTFITYGVTTDGNKIDWLKYITNSKANVRSFVKEIDNDEITSIDTNSCFANCVNLTKIRFSNLTEISATASNAFNGCVLLSEIECDSLLRIKAQASFQNCPSLNRLNLPNLISIEAVDAFDLSPLREINIPRCSVLSQKGIFKTPTRLINVIVGTLTLFHINAFGIVSIRMNFLRNFTIGVNTDIDLPLYQWTATNVIAEGQSGIDELNTNLYNNLLTKLYDHSTDGQTRTLRLGWLAHVTQENIDYANAKGWTLTT